MKLINESIAHTFSRNETDKISSLGIGKISMIKKWLKEYDDDYDDNNYDITDDYVINTKGSVNINEKIIGEFPSYIQFGVIRGTFSCCGCGLTSLRGCPKIVERTFRCADNDLKSLEFCPIEVGDNFTITNNKLTSLKYCPKKINGDFFCSKNQLTSLGDGPDKVGGAYFCRENQILSLDDYHCVVHDDLNIRLNPLSLDSVKRFRESDHNNIRGEILYI